ncbi:hypothetical protein F4695_004063 [Rhizobium soli]|uniref:Uncharacterized protein n=1 Tax=Rhizobium soli TaxID=424798 RepID=A0A7X0JPX3_9HYPH|nr:hypothetical protein [Rhizobium soli]
MRRHRVLRHRERARYVTCGQSIRFMPDKQAKSFEPGWLSKRSKGENSDF